MPRKPLALKGGLYGSPPEWPRLSQGTRAYLAGTFTWKCAIRVAAWTRPRGQKSSIRSSRPSLKGGASAWQRFQGSFADTKAGCSWKVFPERVVRSESLSRPSKAIFREQKRLPHPAIFKVQAPFWSWTTKSRSDELQ